jgi:hypothetical protein
MSYTPGFVETGSLKVSENPSSAQRTQKGRTAGGDISNATHVCFSAATISKMKTLKSDICNALQ